MTVQDNYTPVKLLGNGVNTDFDFSWQAYATSDLVIYLEDVSTGDQTLQTEGVDYTVTLDNEGADGGTVTFTVAPTSSYYVIISRSVPYSQPSEYKTSSGFQASVVETSFDRNTVLIQQTREIADRSLKLPLGTSGDARLPVPEDGATLIWDGTGGDMENGPTSTEIENAEGYATAAAASASAASGSASSASASATAAAESAASVNLPEIQAGDAGKMLEVNTGETGYAFIDNIDTDQIADSAITAAKIDSESATDGQVLTADGSGGVAYEDVVAATLGTEQSTTSGTTKTFSSIPSGTKVIRVMLSGVSLSGSDDLLIQLGGSGGIETSGYASACGLSGAGAIGSELFTTGFGLRREDSATAFSGTAIFTLKNESTNEWTAIYNGTRGNTAGIFVGGGAKTLSSELTQLRLATNGSNSFDGGSVNIMYE